MGVNRVVFGDQTIMDITDSTVDPGNVVEGNVFYASNGERQVGTLSAATAETDGLMSAIDKAKLDNINIDCRSAAEWAAAAGYIPPAHSILIYTDNYNIKIGDGMAYAVDLPFVTDSVRTAIIAALQEHAANGDVHTSLAEKEFWNNKLNYELEGELLILNRN